MDSPFINVFLFSFFWAVQIFVSKLAFIKGAEVIPFTVQSGLVASVMITLYIFTFKRNKLKELLGPFLALLIFASAVHNGLGGVFSNAGISLTTAINAAFLIQFSTVTTTLLAWILLKEKMTTSKIITILTIMIGTLFLITKGKLTEPHVGDLLILLGCLSWSTGNVLVRKILKNHKIDSDLVSFLRPISGLPILFGAIWISPIFPTATKILFQKNLLDIHLFIYVFFNSLFAVLLWIFLNRTLKIASASYMTMMSSLTPVLVALMAIVFLKESLEPIQWFGVFLIIISGFTTQILKIEKH